MSLEDFLRPTKGKVLYSVFVALVLFPLIIAMIGFVTGIDTKWYWIIFSSYIGDYQFILAYFLISYITGIPLSYMDYGKILKPSRSKIVIGLIIAVALLLLNTMLYLNVCTWCPALLIKLYASFMFFPLLMSKLSGRILFVPSSFLWGYIVAGFIIEAISNLRKFRMSKYRTQKENRVSTSSKRKG